MEELTKLLGLGPPVAAGGAIYWLFCFLDKKASDEANQAVASWVKGESYNRIDLGKAVIGAFDNIYGMPLFRWKAFRRSVLLSLCAIAIYAAIATYIAFESTNRPRVNLLLAVFGWLEFATPIIISDYLSLFVIRKCLRYATKNLLLATLISLVFGFVITSIIVNIYGFFILISMYGVIGVRDTIYVLTSTYLSFSWVEAVAPAFLVHLWLPLLLIGALLNRGVSAFFRTAGLAQRFMKHGDEHPFDAIGIVAATVVFVVTAVWTIGSHFI